jgi:hypothetical protein
MQYLEARLAEVERILRDLARAAAELAQRVVALEQKAALIGGTGGTGGTGGGAGYFGCTLSAALAHGSSISGQTVWKMPGRVTVTAAGTVYNDGPTATNDIASGKQVILAANDDGTYTATGVYC